MRAAAMILTLGLAACNPFGAKLPVGVTHQAEVSEQANGALLVTVRAEGASLGAVRESARYAVTQYCMKNTGSSVADWVLDGSGDWAQARDDRGNLILRSRCRG